jgi:hypothetical protein
MWNQILLRGALAMLAFGLATLAFAQSNPGLHFGVIPREDYEVEYVPPPHVPARSVVFAGEALQLRIGFANPYHPSETITTRDRSFEQAFAVVMTSGPEGAAVPTLTAATTGRLTAYPADRKIAWGDDIVIPINGTATFDVSIGTTPTTPAGVYELRITPNLTAGSKIVGVTDILRYEVRTPSTFADQVELLYRQVMREYSHDNPTAAEAACNALLKKYPTSAAAYRVKGYLAAAAGHEPEAIAALTKARELLASGQDELWRLQHPNETPRAVTELTQRIDAIARNTPSSVH